MKSIEKQIEACHLECRRCVDDFIKFEGRFDSKMCKNCLNGRKLHDLEIRTSDAEKKWDACDWNSTKYNDYYKG